uniref:DUF1618 domain-containing protein n=1 Tax=Oryza nivara TaxID=4536 RepID=A0A0E0HLZ8_ORYNI
MGLSRRFLNLIVDNRIPGAKSLRCIDLTLARYKLFNTTTPAALTLNGNGNGLKKRMEKICLPSPIFNLGAPGERIHMFPALERRAFSLDQSGRGLLLEADTSRLVVMPNLHKPKLEPIALYIPGAEIDLDDLDGGGGGTLFIMDRIAKPQEADYLFEALVYRMICSSYLSKSWDCQLLPPPPPYVVKCGVDFLKIISYGLVKGGSEICISIDGVGTYCFDTVKHTWIEVGKWMLPFQGKFEYVHELKLWFGFTPNDGHFAVADLSAMDEYLQPQIRHCWNELDESLIQGWKQIRDPQLVNLGSAKFCIARFFHTGDFGDGLSGQNVSVLTGVEFTHANVDHENIGLIKHKSRCHKSSCGEETITAVF